MSIAAKRSPVSATAELLLMLPLISDYNVVSAGSMDPNATASKTPGMQIVFAIPYLSILYLLYLSKVNCTVSHSSYFGHAMSNDIVNSKRVFALTDKCGEQSVYLRPNSITLSGSKLVAFLQRAEIWPTI